MSQEHAKIGKIDCRGMTRSHPDAPGNTDHFLIAEVRPSLHVQESNLSIDDATKIFGSVHGVLLLVADGVGDDRDSGQRASTVVIDVINRYLVTSFDVRHELNPIKEQQLLDDLKLSLMDCREQLLREVSASDRFSSMDTTLTMAYVVWPRAYIVHVGNSRVYHNSSGILTRVTNDSLSAANVLGTTGDGCQPENAVIDLAVGDVLLLCSDGVTRTTSDDELKRAIDETRSASETCEAVLSTGSTQLDDATVVVARFLDRETVMEEAQAAAEQMPARQQETPAATIV